MNRVPVVGDVVVINRVERIVIMSGTRSVGSSNIVVGYIINTIKRTDLGKANAKIKSITIGLMPHLTEEHDVLLSEIGFIEQIKLKTEVTYFQK